MSLHDIHQYWSFLYDTFEMTTIIIRTICLRKYRATTHFENITANDIMAGQWPVRPLGQADVQGHSMGNVNK